MLVILFKYILINLMGGNSMTEYEVRGKIIKYVEEKIEKGVGKYHNLYSENIQQLVLFPLISLEIAYDTSVPEHLKNYIHRFTTGWLLSVNYDLYNKMKINRNLLRGEFDHYEKKIYPVLSSIMQDYRTLLELKDGNSFAKSKITKETLGKYRLITSLVSDKYNKEAIYFNVIDFAIYDTASNHLLVIECKWKFNHYLNELDEQYVKIQNTLNKIFNEQISKHKVYLRDKKNIDNLFDENDRIVEIKEKPKIFYLAIDKRNQLHLQGNHLITVYMLLYLFEKYSNEEILDLKNLIIEIEELKTTVEYFNISEDKVYKVNENIQFITEDLELEYNF